MTYRKRINSDVWHWIPACSWWPRLVGEESVGDNRPGAGGAAIKERARKPTSGELCNECLAKAKAKARS